jgi:hypothetical protein
MIFTPANWDEWYEKWGCLPHPFYSEELSKVQSAELLLVFSALFQNVGIAKAVHWVKSLEAQFGTANAPPPSREMIVQSKIIPKEWSLSERAPAIIQSAVLFNYHHYPLDQWLKKTTPDQVELEIRGRLYCMGRNTPISRKITNFMVWVALPEPEGLGLIMPCKPAAGLLMQYQKDYQTRELYFSTVKKMKQAKSTLEQCRIYAAWVRYQYA